MVHLRSEKFLWLALALLLAMRLLTLGSLPYLDPSDSRYALIADQMQSSGNWMIPHVTSGGEMVPFSAKPPGSFWLVAASFKVFGTSEFAARLPNFLVLLLATVLIVHFVTPQFGRMTALLSALIFSSSALVFILAGTTLVDPLLSLLLMMGLFYLHRAFSTETSANRSFYLATFFFALGMMVKGPISIVFPAAILIFDLLISRDWARFRILPWGRAVLLFAVIIIPWYWLAEIYDPGFLRYFLIEENFKRFLSADPTIRNGSAHHTPLGVCWLFLPVVILPWILLNLERLWEFRRAACWRALIASPSARFLFSWVFAPVVLLTFGRQVLVPYLLPLAPAASILLARSLLNEMESNKGAEDFRLRVSVLSWIGLLMTCGALVIVLGYEHLEVMDSVPFEIPIVVAFSILAAAIFIFHRRTQSALERLAICCLIFGCVWSGLTISFSEIVSDRYSTRSLLNQIRRAAPPTGEQQSVAFLLELPFSAVLYAKDRRQQQVQISVFDADTDPLPDVDYIALRRSQLESVPAVMALPKEVFGKWHLFHVVKRVATAP